MNLSLYIARKITKGGKENQRLSKPIIQIAMGGIILGMAVMILT
ncbi:MAG: ABC transporter permease, partial [Bacteroidia bacterium]|nr:ABC transporter permease [Bacteroidia bacterium]